MNYIGCFNRSRDGLQVCSPFFFVLVPRCCQVWSVAAGAPLRRSWCLDAARRGVLPPCPLRPSLVPRCFQAWSVVRCTILRRSWCASMLPGVECYPCTFCARSGAPFAPTLLRYTYYSISQILEFLQPCPLLAARYRLYSISQRSGICEQI